jgi:acyl-CoA synthetase (AMP-forming)/AMP-acid ligase II
VFEDTGAQALVVTGEIPDAPIQAARACGLRVFVADPKGERAGDWTLAGTAPARAPSTDGPAQPEDIALYLHTSGTTARPKLVPILHSSLVSSADGVRRSVKLTDNDCGLSIMPLFHVHGLVAALMAPLMAGGRVWCTPGFQAGRFHDWLAESGATWYTAVPTMHQAILMRRPREPRTHRLRFIRSCSAPLPESVWLDLRTAFGVPVVQAYGMTEAAHQISCTTLGDDAAETGSVGLSTGPEIAIVDGTAELQPPGITGEVVLRGSSVIRAYAGPVEANASAYVNGWFRTGDQGYIDTHGYLRLTGRLKELINRGGEKISPYEVEEVLLRHSGVEQAVAFAVPDNLLGEVVGAAVVPKDGESLTAAEVRKWCRGTLAAFKVPRDIVVVDSLPRGSTGKFQRIGMAARLGLPARLAKAAAR